MFSGKGRSPWHGRCGFPSSKLSHVRTVALLFVRTFDCDSVARAMVLHAGTRKVTFVSDFIFIGQGRLEYSLNVVAPAVLAGELVSFEQSIAQKLVKKAGANVA